jgi:HEAT repeat protein
MMPPPIEEIIAELANPDKPLLNSGLAELSNLQPQAQEFFNKIWPTIETKRRREIISRLVELAEDNFELDFDNIFKECLSDPDAEIRSQSIEGLWENEEPSLIGHLINLLENDKSEMVQATAATALGKFVTLAQDKKLRSSHISNVYQVLLAAVRDKSKSDEVRRRVLEAASPICLPEVAAAIRAAYRSADHKLKVSAIFAMGKNCDPAWLNILLTELGSPDAEIRYEAAKACGELGEEEAVPHLIKLAQESDIDIQLAAVQALGQIGGTEAKNYLEDCLDDPNELIQQAAEQALKEIEMGEEPFSF